MDNRPIGIFDSGVGGLTVRAAIARLLPTESLVYFGDGANVPYGPRSKEEIIALVDGAFERLTGEGVKMVVVACNAATGAAIDYLRVKYDIPIIGMVPAVKPAAATSPTGVIGVLATVAAFKGNLYKTAVAEHAQGVRIIEVVGEGFVELVENDLEDSAEAGEIVRRAVEPMLAGGTDRIVLGCTHYPFLVRQIESVAGRNVLIVDPAPAIARRVEQLLSEGRLHADPKNIPSHRFLSCADNAYCERLMRKSAEVPEAASETVAEKEK